MAEHLISIFLPYYNDEKSLTQSIESILKQTYSNFELILFNHASTDSSRNIAHSFTDERIIHIDSSINYGAGAGLNLWENLPNFKGDFVKVFCADDIMKPNHLYSLQKAMTPDTDVVVANKIDFINRDGQIITINETLIPNHSLKAPKLEWELLKFYFNSNSILPWGNALIKKQALIDIPHDNSMIYLFDMSFWVNLLINNKKFFILEESISYYRKSKENMTSKKSEHITQACYFEHLAYCDLFYKIQDVELAKYLCDNVPVPIKDELEANDISLIPFLIALEYAYKPSIAYPRKPIMDIIYLNSMYQKIYLLLQDDETRNKLQKRFNFTIKDFRNLYTNKRHNHLFYKRHKLTNFISKLIK